MLHLDVGLLFHTEQYTVASRNHHLSRTVNFVVLGEQTWSLTWRNCIFLFFSPSWWETVEKNATENVSHFVMTDLYVFLLSL